MVRGDSRTRFMEDTRVTEGERLNSSHTAFIEHAAMLLPRRKVQVQANIPLYTYTLRKSL